MKFDSFSYFILFNISAIHAFVVNINNQDHKLLLSHIFLVSTCRQFLQQQKYSKKLDYEFEKKGEKKKTKEGWFFISQYTQRSCFGFSFFQSNFFAHPQDLTDAEITEYVCNLNKCAMGLMTAGTTQMKKTVVVNPFNVK